MTAAAFGPVGDVGRAVVYSTSTPVQRAQLEAAGPADWTPTVAQVRAVLTRAKWLMLEEPLATLTLGEAIRFVREAAAGEIARTVVDLGSGPSPEIADWFRSVNWVHDAWWARQLRRLERDPSFRVARSVAS